MQCLTPKLFRCIFKITLKYINILPIDVAQDNTGCHGHLVKGSVDDAYDVATSGSLEGSEERLIEAVLGIKLDHLFVISRVGNLEQLNPCIERPSVIFYENLHAIDAYVEFEYVMVSTLDCYSRGR